VLCSAFQADICQPDIFYCVGVVKCLTIYSRILHNGIKIQSERVHAFRMFSVDLLTEIMPGFLRRIGHEVFNPEAKTGCDYRTQKGQYHDFSSAHILQLHSRVIPESTDYSARKIQRYCSFNLGQEN